MGDEIEALFKQVHELAEAGMVKAAAKGPQGNRARNHFRNLLQVANEGLGMHLADRRIAAANAKAEAAAEAAAKAAAKAAAEKGA